MSVDQNRLVRVALDTDGYCILAGDPNYNDRASKKELIDLIAKGYTIKTIKYSEYLQLQWVSDRPDYKK